MTTNDKNQGKMTLTLKSDVKLKATRNLTKKNPTTIQVEVKRKKRVVGGESQKDANVITEDNKVSNQGSKDKLSALKKVTENEKIRMQREQVQRDEVHEKQRRDQEKESRNNKSSTPVEEVSADKVAAPLDVSASEAAVDKSGSSLVRNKEASPGEREDKPKPIKASKGDNKRRSGRMTVTQVLSGATEERERSLASVKRARAKAKRAMQGPGDPKEKLVREVIVPEVISVQELANRMAERVTDVIKVLMKMGMMVSANQTIDADTAELVTGELGHKIKRVSESDVESVLIDEYEDKESDLNSRAPIVTFMGHVDHGKTSLLDAIRETHVADKEAGGITQHIGAYQVKTGDDYITFLDTPGHEAFTAMRRRGASATDIVVLVVAADDGIMAQTIEAINHAKAAEVGIIVAINKIDKPGADIQRVKNALLEHDIILEDFGGDILSAEVSAKECINLDKLLEAILLQSEILDLRANHDRKSVGVVIESKVDKGKGAVATLLVQKGTLKIGNIVVAGEYYGKIRAMADATGKNLAKAGPSVPVEVLGFDGAPDAGLEFSVVTNERQAREVAEYRKKRNRDLKTVVERKGTIEELFSQAADGGVKELPIIIKADVQGSVEAIIGSVDKLPDDEIKIKILHTGVGGINESDVSLAAASNALIFGFNVRAGGTARDLLAKEGVDVRYYSIIYDLIDDVKAVLSGMLEPNIKEKFIGMAEIRDIFNMSKYGKVSGCYVTEGVVKRGAGVRILRDNVVVYEGKLKTLRRFKDDVKEVGVNFECGMAFENYEDIKVGDMVEAFEFIEEAREIK